MGLAKKIDKKYTYLEYKNWPQNEKWEIIDGNAYMQVAPSWLHQNISAEIFYQFKKFFENKNCKPFFAPFDVSLLYQNENEDNCTTVVQPDISVVCDMSKLKGTGYVGTPSLIVEIVSPSTAQIDKLYKFNKYESTKVQEYWIVEPENRIISVFYLQDNNRYGRPDVYSEKDDISSKVFDGLIVDCSKLFPEE